MLLHTLEVPRAGCPSEPCPELCPRRCSRLGLGAAGEPGDGTVISWGRAAPGLGEHSSCSSEGIPDTAKRYFVKVFLCFSASKLLGSQICFLLPFPQLR